MAIHEGILRRRELRGWKSKFLSLILLFSFTNGEINWSETHGDSFTFFESLNCDANSYFLLRSEALQALHFSPTTRKGLMKNSKVIKSASLKTDHASLTVRLGFAPHAQSTFVEQEWTWKHWQNKWEPLTKQMGNTDKQMGAWKIKNKHVLWKAKLSCRVHFFWCTLIIIKHSRDSIVFGTGLARIKVFPKRIRNDLNSEVQVKIEVCGREKDNEAYDRLYSLF